MNDDQRIAACRTSVSQIYHMLNNAPQTWRNYVDLARSVIVHVDATTYMQRPSNVSEQAWMIAGLQQLAFLDSDRNLVDDIAAWCSRQWLALLERDRHNVAALRGIGQSWLVRAQPVLSRIHHLEGSSSSSGDSSSRSAGSGSGSAGNQNTGDEVTTNATADEAERRINTQEYVEARQYLQPATEYLNRAVAAATTQEALSGDLLATVSVSNEQQV